MVNKLVRGKYTLEYRIKQKSSRHRLDPPVPGEGDG
jgi:hypothetical protein